MREIMFRGKRVDNGEWTYGYLFKCWGRCYLLWGMNGDNPIKEEVYPETVGECTGLTDNNGKCIFEGDIVADNYDMKGLVEFFTEDIGSCGCCVPQFDGSGFKAKYKKLDSGVDMRSCTIVGNIFDNPEMWEEEE